MKDLMAELLEERTLSQEEESVETPEQYNLEDDSEDDGIDSPEEGSKETGEPEEADKDQDEPEKDSTEEWEKEKANLEKRVNDNRASYQREHQAKLDLEKRLAELEAKQKEESDDDDDWLSDDYDDKQDSKELKELRDQVEDLKKSEAERAEAAASEAWERAAEPERKKFDDFDEVVDKVAAAYEADADIQAKFEELGRTPEAAYKIGKELEKRELMKDPDKYEAYLREKLKKELLENKDSVDDLDELEANSSGQNLSLSQEVDLLDRVLG